MTATAQMSEQLFPTVVDTEVKSLNYMKRLTAVAISNILYLRNAFPEDCYGHRKLDDLKLRILTEKCETQTAKHIVQWVKGCFDAMEKKYLKQLTLGVYVDPEDPNELLEAYSFRFSYESNKVDITLESGKRDISKLSCDESVGSELRLATVKLLRSLVIMVQALEKLPDDCFLTMKLLYYEGTPADYEPPGFMLSDVEHFTFKGKPISISAGEVQTPFHSVKVKIRTNQTQFEDFVGSDSSDAGGKPKASQELTDDCECDSLAIDDESKDGSMGSVSPSDKPLAKSKQPMQERTSNLSQEQNQWLSCSKRSKDSAAKSGQKSKENTITSKMREMKVEDNAAQKRVKSEGGKRKQEFEVTQDSLFNVVADKRVKASKPRKDRIGLGRRRR